jgi:hypothetical protein
MKRDRWIPALSALVCGIALSGCLESLKPDQPALTSISTAPRTVPDCASCHAYPLHDVNHSYHLNSLNTWEGVQAKFVYERKNGAILCMDCHFGSIAHRAYNWYDTIWGTEGDLRSTADKLPNDPIYRIDSIPGFLPLPAAGGPVTSVRIDSLIMAATRIGTVAEWLTAGNHLNGTVDVEFSPNIVLDTALSKKAYRPQDLSCSTIECHNAPKKTYRWASKSLGLTGCPSLEHTPQLDSSCGYSTKQEPK